MARMRLLRRSRAPRPLPEGWVTARESGRWTTIGNLDSRERAAVDPAGLVTVDGRTWSLDWWVGAEDRWHLPSQEVAVRQTLLGNSPVTETRLKVPSGDAVHRAYVARNQAGDEAVIVEIANESKVPFAIALAVRPHGQGSTGRVDEVGVDGLWVTVDGAPVVVLPRSPGRMVLSDGSVDSGAVVVAGDAEPVAASSVSAPEGLGNAALLFPLAHSATLRVAVPLTADSAARIDPESFPGPSDVASGWARQAGTGWRIELPDRRLRDAAAASVRHLLLARRTLTTLRALDLAGFHDEVARHLAGNAIELSDEDHPGLALATVARHWELTRDQRFASEVVDLVGALVARLGRSPAGPDRDTGQAVLGQVALLLEAAGQMTAAADVGALVAAASEPDTPAAEGDLPDLLRSATGVWTWPGSSTGHDPAANARLVVAVRNGLVGESVRGLTLSPTVPDSWLGQGWEVHGAPTRHGRLSYAVRWHGDRPALLWELERHDPALEVAVTAPALDQTWTSTASSGEALLGPVAMPDKGARKGISMAVTIDSTPRRRDG